jgi:hypothetical protein
MRIFVCKLRLLFSDNKHLRGFIGDEIFGNFFRHSEIFGLHPQLYMLATALPPPPLANISGKHFLGALFILKVPLETRAPPNFLKLLSLSIVLIAFDATKIRRIKWALQSLL